MLNFRNTNIFFIAVLLFVLVTNITTDIPFFVYPALLFAYSLVVFYGCYCIDSNFFLPVICSANTTAKEIAISFDDGPWKGGTPMVLAILRQHDVKATFFCIGNRICGNEELVKQLHNEGHLVGNHSHSHHFWFDLFSAKKMLADLQRMDNELVNITGLKPRLFRPPYGVTNPNLKKAILKGGYIPVGWSVRSMDTVLKNESKLLGRLQASLKPGAVFLFHDTSGSMVRILPEFIRWVNDCGYKIVRLDKLLNLKAYE